MTYTGSEHRYLVDVLFHVDAVDEGEAFAQVSNALVDARMPPDGLGDPTVGEGVTWVSVLDAEHQPEGCSHLDHLLDHMTEIHHHRREGLEEVTPAEVEALHAIEHKLITASHANQGIHEVVPEHDASTFFSRTPHEESE